MGIRLKALSLVEMAIPVKAVFNNFNGNVDEDLSIYGITQVQWSDGTFSEGIKHPGCCFYIEADGKKILVDTGVGDLEQLRQIRNARGDKYYLFTKPEWDLKYQLEKMGVGLDDIDIVINSHLHWDHVGGNKLFKNAQFFMPKEDIPLALTGPKYAPHFFKKMSSCITEVADRTTFLDGDAKIVEGVEVWKVGGHTPGSQVIAVKTDKGVVALTTDVVCKYDNWEHDWIGPAGNIWNIGELVNAHQTIRQRSDFIIPGHDWKVWEYYRDGIIA